MPDNKCQFKIPEIVRNGNMLLSKKRTCQNNAMNGCNVCYAHRLQCALIKKK